jgi:hypothetical protein
MGLAGAVNHCLQDYLTQKSDQEMARLGHLGRLGHLSMDRAHARLPLRTGQVIYTSNVSYLVQYVE